MAGNLRRYIELMMETDMIREKKLKVTNEITNVMEYYNSSFPASDHQLYGRIRRLAEEQGIKLDNQAYYHGNVDWWRPDGNPL